MPKHLSLMKNKWDGAGMDTTPTPAPSFCKSCCYTHDSRSPFVLNMFGTDYAVLTGKFIESRRGNCYDRIEEKTWKGQMT